MGGGRAANAPHPRTPRGAEQMQSAPFHWPTQRCSGARGRQGAAGSLGAGGGRAGPGGALTTPHTTCPH